MLNKETFFRFLQTKDNNYVILGSSLIRKKTYIVYKDQVRTYELV